jgi:hypothetical protein
MNRPSNPNDRHRCPGYVAPKREGKLAISAYLTPEQHQAAKQIAQRRIALLDRGWGRPTQPISGDDEMPPVGFEARERVANLVNSLHEKLRSGGESLKPEGAPDAGG